MSGSVSPAFLQYLPDEVLEFDDPPSNVQDEFVKTFWYLSRSVREKIQQNHPKKVFFCFHRGFCTYQCSGDEVVDQARLNLHFVKKPDHKISRDQLSQWKELAMRRRSLMEKRKKSSNAVKPVVGQEDCRPGRSQGLSGSSSRSPMNRVERSRSPHPVKSSTSRRARRNSESNSYSRICRRSPLPGRKSNSPMPSRSSLSIPRSPTKPRSRSPISNISSASRSQEPSRSQDNTRRSKSPREARGWQQIPRRCSSPPPSKTRRFRSSLMRDNNMKNKRRRPAPHHRYSANPGPMGRYNSRLDQRDGEEVASSKEWTCKKCSEIFYKQAKYIEHVEVRNIRKKCPEKKLLDLEEVKEIIELENSSTATNFATHELQPPYLHSKLPLEIVLEDSPPLIIGLNKPPPIIPQKSLNIRLAYLDNISDSDDSLPPIVPPPLTSLDPISDQSLPTSPTDLSSPVQVTSVASSALLILSSSPPRFSPESQSRVSLREDGVLVYEDVFQELNNSNFAQPKMIKFAKNLFRSRPDLVNIPNEDDPTPVETKKSAEKISLLAMLEQIFSPNTELQQRLEASNEPIDSKKDDANNKKQVEPSKKPVELGEGAFLTTCDTSILSSPDTLNNHPPVTVNRTHFMSNLISGPVSSCVPEVPSSVQVVQTAVNSARTTPDATTCTITAVTIKCPSTLLVPTTTHASESTEFFLTLIGDNQPTDSAEDLDMGEKGVEQNQKVMKLDCPLLHGQLDISPPKSPVAHLHESVHHSLVPSYPETTPPVDYSPEEDTDQTCFVREDNQMAQQNPSANPRSKSLVSPSSPTYSISYSVSPNYLSRPNNSTVSSSSPILLASVSLFSTPASPLVSSSNNYPDSPSQPSPPATTPPLHQGEVMSLYQALGGSNDSEEEEPEQLVVVRAGVDSTDKCPRCSSRLDTGPAAVNFSINFSDLSVLVDCIKCDVRVKVMGALGSRQRTFLSCGM